VPNLTVIRPADANETAVAWRVAIEHCDAPVSLVFTRQAVPTLDRSRMAAADGLRRGGYVLDDGGADPAVILIASGSEVHLVVDAAQRLRETGLAVRCVSMPSWELFDAQPQDYRDSVLPPSIHARLAVEAGATQGWSKYVGDICTRRRDAARVRIHRRRSLPPRAGGAVLGNGSCTPVSAALHRIGCLRCERSPGKAAGRTRGHVRE
jgi:transketolase